MSENDTIPNPNKPRPTVGIPNAVDVDAALAAVSQLTTMTGDDSSHDNTPETPTTVIFETPKHISMQRKQLASLVPAVTLILIGGWLTFTLTTTHTLPASEQLRAVGFIALGVVLLSQWLNTSRWSRGNFFVGLSALLFGGVQILQAQFAPIAAVNNEIIWSVIIGIALLSTGYLARPRQHQLGVMGILAIVVGGVGYLLTSNIITPEFMDTIGNLWLLPVPILGALFILSFVRQRN
jgi:uncharacterized membrane protein